MPASLPQMVVDDGVTVIGFDGLETIDERQLDAIRTWLEEAAQQAASPRIVLDLSAVRFFGSSFLALLLKISSQLRKESGAFALCGVTDHCSEVLSMTHLDKIWPIYADRAAAASACRQAAAG